MSAKSQLGRANQGGLGVSTQGARFLDTEGSLRERGIRDRSSEKVGSPARVTTVFPTREYRSNIVACLLEEMHPKSNQS